MTADAARSRWDRIIAARREQAQERATVDDRADAAWKRVAEQVENAEADTLDWIVEALNGIRDQVAALDTRLNHIEAEQQRLRELWQ